MLKKLFLVAVVVVIGIGRAQAEPKFQLDTFGKRVVLISNLYPLTETCDPRQFRSKVVKRQFDDSATMIEGFVLEHSDGSRDYINVGADLKGASMNASEWIVRGLQTLLAEGHVVDVVVKFCGVSGHIVNLDAVREVPPWEGN